MNCQKIDQIIAGEIDFDDRDWKEIEADPQLYTYLKDRLEEAERDMPAIEQLNELVRRAIVEVSFPEATGEEGEVPTGLLDKIHRRIDGEAEKMRREQEKHRDLLDKPGGDRPGVVKKFAVPIRRLRSLRPAAPVAMGEAPSPVHSETWDLEGGKKITIEFHRNRLHLKWEGFSDKVTPILKATSPGESQVQVVSREEKIAAQTAKYPFSPAEFEGREGEIHIEVTWIEETGKLEVIID